MFKQLLEKIIGEKAPGPSPTFSMVHMLLALDLMAEKTIGRSKLAYSLDVGEGAIRTIIGRLKEAGLITTSKAGCTLTNKGLKLWEEHKSIFKKKSKIVENELTLGTHNFAILVKNCGHKVKSGMGLRDTAIMAGARSATTILFQDGRLVIPSVSDNVTKDFPKAAGQIVTLLKPEENDVVIIVSADNMRQAEYGALTAAWTLINDLRK